MRSNPWLEARNVRNRARLERSLPDIFPGAILHHALTRPLVPPTARRAVESYWRHHPLRADRLARALARRSGSPEGWEWRLDSLDEGTTRRLGGFRIPPTPYREAAFARGPGSCCVCGQPVFRFGWHADLWAHGKTNKRASWHSACVSAWQLWCDPTGQIKPLKRAQRHRCGETGKRLLRDAEIDHRTPLFGVWRDRAGMDWPQLLDFWGVPNLQVVNREAHRAKCSAEAGLRANLRAALKRANAPIHSDL